LDKTTGPDYNSSLISQKDQLKRLQEFYQHYFATGPNAKSPWDEKFVQKLLNQDIRILENNLLETFSNHNKEPQYIGYGENFRPLDNAWINRIANNMNPKQFALPLKFNADNRGIAIANVHVRVLPTNDVHFYKYSFPGQGYPFDNLQHSALWVGTPVYIIGKTLDQQWSLIITPSIAGWVESNNIAKTAPIFIEHWQKAAAQKLIAIIKTNSTIVDNHGNYRFNAYVGAVFPASIFYRNLILIPIAAPNHSAKIRYTRINQETMATMPLSATPHNFVSIISTLINRTYGWGNMYFYNDCSDELKNLYTPFGIWLPRNSSEQVNAGRKIDLSSKNLEQRLAYLAANGHKLTTIVYIGGHIFMYLGTYSSTIMTYQNIWGLHPKDNSSRAVIGKSVLLPLLKNYPEDANLDSLGNRAFFQLAYLDQIPPHTMEPQFFDLKAMTYPELFWRMLEKVKNLFIQ